MAMKAGTEKLIEEQRNVASETSALASQLNVLRRNASRVEGTGGALKEKIAGLKQQLAALEEGDRSIQQQILDLKAEHEAYRKRNPLN